MIDLHSISILATGALGASQVTSSTPQINLQAVDYSILGIYILVVIGIGFVLKKHVNQIQIHHRSVF